MNDESRNRVRSLISEKSIQAQLRHTTNNSRVLKDLKYDLDGAGTKKSRRQRTVQYSYSQLTSIRSSVDHYCQRLLLYKECFVADVTDGFNVFPYDLLEKAQKLAWKRQEDIETTATTDFDAIDYFLWRLDSKLRRQKRLLRITISKHFMRLPIVCNWDAIL